ncbi:hypothetical protein SacmaDRAFT_2571 [Saccharomonospora marina XMU15]|uniref:DUF2231 domain-containing protein n=1 Tax=Saccharomonospora marina XMU15 TaxID=882083 RepID=H5X0L7_9PSEU|nr:DUF2231 domain-containing protein [Saccharomonospora marina]EHR50813.1 hypothetical protein SacmaDRAFT_2571 [Saccharomonospora marina XMU15]
MPTFVAGLPLHVLVVHAVVVLVPLALLAAVTVAVWPAARRRYGWAVVGLASLAAVSIPIATSSGEGLRSRLAATPLIAEHAELGDQLLAVFVPMVAAVTAVVAIEHFRGRRRANTEAGTRTVPVTTARWARPVATLLALITIAFAAGSAVQVVRIGDSGARAAWSGTHYVAAHDEEDD